MVSNPFSPFAFLLVAVVGPRILDVERTRQ